MDADTTQTIAEIVKRWTAAYNQSDFAGAKTILTGAAAEFPDRADLTYRLAMTEFRLGSLSEAVRHATKAASLDATDPAPGLFLSALLLQNGFLDAARSQAHAVLERSPENPSAQMRLSEIALRNGDAREAHRWADAFVANHPDNVAGYLARANVHIQFAEYAFAEAALAVAARLAPNNAGIQNKLAVLEALGDAK